MPLRLKKEVGRFENYEPGALIKPRDEERYRRNYARLVEEVPDAEPARARGKAKESDN